VRFATEDVVDYVDWHSPTTKRSTAMVGDSKDSRP
jgi:hypothetical protein